MVHRKYIDSHYLTFISKGLLALLFGWLALFNSGNGIDFLISLLSVFLLGLSIIEFGNSLHRAHQATGWVISVAVALFDAIIAIAILCTMEQNIAVHLIILAAYTVLRGLAEIIIAFRTTVDPTDRFIWLLSGICGAVMGVGILNSGHLATATFIRFFGAYLCVVATCNLIYGVHNHSQKIEDHEARSAAAREARAARSVRTLKSLKKRRKSTKK